MSAPAGQWARALRLLQAQLPAAQVRAPAAAASWLRDRPAGAGLLRAALPGFLCALSCSSQQAGVCGCSLGAAARCGEGALGRGELSVRRPKHGLKVSANQHHRLDCTDKQKPSSAA